jgi:flagellar biosynthetic protein FlhB
MADKPASERTEEPTPERIKKARAEGQVPQSQEVPTAMMLAVLIAVLALLWPTVYRWFSEEVSEGLLFEHPGAMDAESFAALLQSKAAGALMIVAPFLVAGAAVSLFASLLVSGWSFAPRAVRLDMQKINPATGMKNLLSARNAVRLLISVLKLAAILAIVGLYLADKMDVCLALQGAAPMAVVMEIGQLVFGLLIRMAVALSAIALLDLLYQRRRWRKDLRMTRQELKDELRQYEISPQLRGRLRAVQMEMARKRMLQSVPEADVVVANPTHVAVALKYEAASMEAPQVVAKGADLLAQRIKDIAREHDVPIVERPQLARTLYASTDVGQTIPETLFVAVAEVLAMIYKLRRQRSRPRQGRSEP